MKRRHSTVVAMLALALAASLFAQSGAKGSVTLIHHAKGVFDIKMTPMPADEYADGKALGRVAADKQYHGDLEGSGKGQMLTATGGVTGSAVYVATERVIGNLAGRRGTFLLAHRGVMNRGAQQLFRIVDSEGEFLPKNVHVPGSLLQTKLDAVGFDKKHSGQNNRGYVGEWLPT